MAGERDIHYAASNREAALPAAGPAPRELSSTEAIERDRAAMVLLRQLSSGLSSYRLFPGDLEQPSFVAAVTRIQDAAEKALEWGQFDAEINGNRFITAAGPMPPDERIERLALAFYHHGAEQLVVHEPPDARALGALFEALSRPARDPANPSGVGAALRVAGVRSITVREVAPQSSTGGGELGNLGPEKAIPQDMALPDEAKRQRASKTRLSLREFSRAIRRAAEE